jgi:hypothetical protein
MFILENLLITIQQFMATLTNVSNVVFTFTVGHIIGKIIQQFSNGIL